MEKQASHTHVDTAMENLAILDGMKRDGWSESVIDRVDRAVNCHEELKGLLIHFKEYLEGFAEKPDIKLIEEAIAKAEEK